MKKQLKIFSMVAILTLPVFALADEDPSQSGGGIGPTASSGSDSGSSGSQGPTSDGVGGQINGSIGPQSQQDDSSSGSEEALGGGPPDGTGGEAEGPPDGVGGFE